MVDRIKLARSNLTSSSEGKINSPSFEGFSSSYVPPSNNHQKINQYYLSKNQVANVLSFPPDYSEKFHFKIKMGEFSRNLLTGSQLILGSVKDTIILPMPSSLKNDHGILYSTEEFGIAMGQIENLAGQISSQLQGLQTRNPSNSPVSSGSAAAATVLGAASNTPVLGNIINKVASGVALNRWLTVMFKGPTYKKYTFSWVLSPRNENESIIIKKIYDKINYEAAPRIGRGNLFFEFPTIFQCEFSNHPNISEQSGQMFGFKPAVVEGCSIDLSPGGHASFYSSGYPTSISISLAFQELEFWLKDKGYNDPNKAYYP